MAAAVADFRPSTTVARARSRRARTSPNWIPLTGTRNPGRTGQVPTRRRAAGHDRDRRIRGGDGRRDGGVLTCATGQLRAKGCDLLVVNAVGEGKAFEVDHNDGWLLGADGSEVALEHGSKALMASRVLDAVEPLFRTL